MEHIRVVFPYVQVFLAHRQKHRDIFFLYNMPLAEAGLFGYATDNLREVMAEHMADGIFCINKSHESLLCM